MSTQLVFQIIGAAVGGYFGGPTGAMIGSQTGPAVGGVLDIDHSNAKEAAQGDSV